MKTRHHIILAAIAAAISCTGGQQAVKDPTETVRKQFEACANCAEIFNVSAAERYSEIPDTVFLDFYLTMPRKEVDSLCKVYQANGKLKNDGCYFGADGDVYLYELPISEKRNVTMEVYFEYQDDLLMNLVLAAHQYNGYMDTNYSDLYFFEDYFEPVFIKKGYFLALQGFDEAEAMNEKQARKRAENGVENPFIDTTHKIDNYAMEPSINFFHLNTEILLYKAYDYVPVVLFRDNILRQQFLNRERDKRADDKSIEQGRADF